MPSEQDNGLISFGPAPQPQGLTLLPPFLTARASAPCSRKARPEGAVTAPGQSNAPWLLVASLGFSCSLLSPSCVWSSGAGSRVSVSVAFPLSVLTARAFSSEWLQTSARF